MSQHCNNQRANQARVAIEAFRQQASGDDDATSVQDLITDLGHYCLVYELDFVRIVADGIRMWCAECADPGGLRLDLGPPVSIVIAGYTQRQGIPPASIQKRRKSTRVQS